MKRILRTIRVDEISAVDRPCAEQALVTILKRAPETPIEKRQDILDRARATLNKYNRNHSPQDGRFTSGPGGSNGSSSASSSNGTSSSDNGADHGSTSSGASTVTEPMKDETLRWVRTAVRTAGIAYLGIGAAGTVAAFAAAFPLGVGFAVTAAVAGIVTRAKVSHIVAVIALDYTLGRLIARREKELNKAAPKDDPVLTTLRQMKAELQRIKQETSKEDHNMDKQADKDYEALIASEINGSSMTRDIAAQRLLMKHGTTPDAAKLMKALDGRTAFERAVDKVQQEERFASSRTAAMTETRKRHPDLFNQFQAA